MSDDTQDLKEICGELYNLVEELDSLTPTPARLMAQLKILEGLDILKMENKNLN